MRRFNSQSVARNDLVYALMNEQLVRRAVRIDHCLLCHGEGVSKAGLCQGCTANLTDAEWRAALPWIEERAP